MLTDRIDDSCGGNVPRATSHRCPLHALARTDCQDGARTGALCAIFRHPIRIRDRMRRPILAALCFGIGACVRSASMPSPATATTAAITPADLEHRLFIIAHD